VCGKGPVEKLLYPVAVHFKGSGFYSTDYGRSSRKRETGKEGGESAASGDGTSPDSGSSTEKKAAAADSS
jgi:predicted nucleic acid-binding Zn ribbon protein